MTPSCKCPIISNTRRSQWAFWRNHELERPQWFQKFGFSVIKNLDSFLWWNVTSNFCSSEEQTVLFEWKKDQLELSVSGQQLGNSLDETKLLNAFSHCVQLTHPDPIKLHELAYSNIPLEGLSTTWKTEKGILRTPFWVFCFLFLIECSWNTLDWLFTRLHQCPIF